MAFSTSSIFLLLAGAQFTLASPVASTTTTTADFPCISSGDQTAINERFAQNGRGHVVQLCQGAVIDITDTVSLQDHEQELSTEGYPTGDQRGTIRLVPGTNASTAVFAKFKDGIKLRNIIVDGNRAETGYSGGDANIDIGGPNTGQVVDHVASRNPRGWSCLAVGFGGQSSADADPPCTNATLTNNDIGPCGLEDKWADGVSFQCTDSIVSDNTIVGSTDGGIVIFGAPGTQVLRNTITSSATDRAFGAINLVDAALYGGSYAGVAVRDNVITGGKLFNVGISIGQHVWSFASTTGVDNSGPVTVANNTFAGNIPFAIAINGWRDGLTVTDNAVSALAPSSSFASAAGCDAAIQHAFAANEKLVYYADGLAPPYTLSPDFAATAGNATNFLCTAAGAAASRLTFAAGSSGMTGKHPSSSGLAPALANGVFFAYQGDNNVVVYDTVGDAAGWRVLWAAGFTVDGSEGCGADGALCELDFQGDGNLVNYVNGTARWNTRTEGRGQTLVLSGEAPWMSILGADGGVVWSTADGVFEG